MAATLFSGQRAKAWERWIEMGQTATILEAPPPEAPHVDPDDLCVVHTALWSVHQYETPHTLSEVLAPGYFNGLPVSQIRKHDRIDCTCNIFGEPEFASLIVVRAVPQLREIAVRLLWRAKP
jgi:hypothetical protein